MLLGEEVMHRDELDKFKLSVLDKINVRFAQLDKEDSRSAPVRDQSKIKESVDTPSRRVQSGVIQCPESRSIKVG